MPTPPAAAPPAAASPAAPALPALPALPTSPSAPEVTLRALDTLWFQVGGTVCNLACRHCFISCSPTNHTHEMMRLGQVRAHLAEAAELGVKEIYFTGGEPFLNPEMEAILEAALAVAPATVLTNGLLLDAARCARLAALAAELRDGPSMDGTRIRELTGGDGVDVVLDVTPMAQQPIRDAIEAVRWGGTIVLAGLKGHKPIELVTDMLINKALTVKGAFSVDAAGYENAIKLIESGKFPLHKMQTHKYGLDDVEHAIKLLAGEVPGEEGIHVAVMPGR